MVQHQSGIEYERDYESSQHFFLTRLGLLEGVMTGIYL